MDFTAVSTRDAGDSRASALTQSATDECPACASTDVHTLFHATDRLYGTTDSEFLVIECRNCKLIRLYPQPTPFELHQYYPDAYWYTEDQGAADRLEQIWRRFVLGDHLRFV
ncbi:MAG: hypothetical protein ABI823_17410, partial [Bryobacteraceae bacterium]